jgi:hypothetical protein
MINKINGIFSIKYDFSLGNINKGLVKIIRLKTRKLIRENRMISPPLRVNLKNSMRQ